MRAATFDVRADEAPHSAFYRHDFKSGVLTIRPAGPTIGQREAVVLNSEITALIKQLGTRLRVLVLDMTDVQAMASLGLGMCIELRNAAHAKNATTIVHALSNDLSALFRLMKVERLYKMAPSPRDLERALAA